MQGMQSGKGARPKGADNLGGKGYGRVGEVRRGGGGPVGADGSVPLLGSRGAGLRGAATGPAKGTTVHLKGNAGEKAGYGKGKGPSGTEAHAANSGTGRAAVPGTQRSDDAAAAENPPSRSSMAPPRVVDEEGFELVQRRRTWAQAVAEGPERREQRTDAAMQGPAAAPRWADDDSEDGGYADDDAHADDGGDCDDGGADAADPRQLRDKYEAYARAVRDLERKSRGNHADPALLTLRAARDSAEREWRDAKSPAPLATRLGRAEARLEKAGNALERARLAVEEFDKWAEARREELVHQVGEAESWYRWRESQLDDLHEEAGGKAQGRKGGAPGPSGCVAAVSGRIMHELLPEIRGIIEFAQGNPEIIDRLSNLAAGLEGAGQELGEDQRGATERYDIGDDDCDRLVDDEDDGMGASPRQDMDRDGQEPRGKGATGWRPEGLGRWTRTRSTEDSGQKPPPPPTPADATGKGAATRGKRGAEEQPAPERNATGTGSSTSQEGNPATAGNDDDGAEDRAAKHRRSTTEAEAREEEDKRRALELHQQQLHAMAAQQASFDAGEGGFGSDTALSIAAQRFVGEVHKALEKAREAGVEPKAGDKDLVELTPMELKKWVRENLSSDADWSW